MGTVEQKTETTFQGFESRVRREQGNTILIYKSQEIY